MSSRLWALVIGAGVAYEAYALRAGRADDTLSQTTRRVFRVDTHRAGRVAFAAAHAGVSAWYLGHILRWWR